MKWDCDFCSDIMTFAVRLLLLQWYYYFCTEIIWLLHMTFALRLWLLQWELLLQWNYDFCSEIITFEVRLWLLQWNYDFCSEIITFAVRLWLFNWRNCFSLHVIDIIFEHTSYIYIIQQLSTYVDWNKRLKVIVKLFKLYTYILKYLEQLKTIYSISNVTLQLTLLFCRHVWVGALCPLRDVKHI